MACSRGCQDRKRPWQQLPLPGVPLVSLRWRLRANARAATLPVIGAVGSGSNRRRVGQAQKENMRRTRSIVAMTSVCFALPSCSGLEQVRVLCEQSEALAETVKANTSTLLAAHAELTDQTRAIDRSREAVDANRWAVLASTDQIARNTFSLDSTAQLLKRNSAVVEASTAAIQSNTTELGIVAGRIARNTEAISASSSALADSASQVEQLTQTMTTSVGRLIEALPDKTRVDRIIGILEGLQRAVENPGFWGACRAAVQKMLSLFAALTLGSVVFLVSVRSQSSRAARMLSENRDARLGTPLQWWVQHPVLLNPVLLAAHVVGAGVTIAICRWILSWGVQS